MHPPTPSAWPLVELGDPAALAASYVDRPLQLIGPRYYLTWWRLLKMLYSVVLPIAVAAVVLAQLLSGADVGDVIGNAIAVGLSLAVHLGFWTTLVFAVLERSPGKGAPTSHGRPTCSRSCPSSVGPVGAASSSARSCSSASSPSSIVWQQFGLPWVDALETIPLLDPDLWSFWIPYFLVLILLEMLFAIAIYAWGWNWWLVVANLVLNVAFVVPALWLFTTGQLINPEALEAMGWPWGDAGDVVVPIDHRGRDRRRRLGRHRRRHQDGARAPARRRDAHARAHLTAARSGCGYFGCIRIAPSRRMTSPLSIGFAMIDRTSAAYSVGCPRRDGCGTCASSDERTSSGMPAIMGVSKMPGAIVTTRMRSFDRSRAIGRVIPATAAFDAE